MGQGINVREIMRMAKIVGVRFRNVGKIYYFDPKDLEIKRQDHVIVETARGMEYGTVVLGPKEVEESEVLRPLKEVLRMATEEDTTREQENRLREREAFKLCQKKIREHQLDMKLIDAEFTFDNSKILFYFTADGRIDFRQLVKDLAAIFKTRIELRQIGVRDETKIMGGIGICGRPLCCHSYLADFVPVSIKMAKEQNLSLNQTKISGVCGRLMCCLKNEQETYETLNKSLPGIGDVVLTPDNIPGTVHSVNVLRQLVKVTVDVNDEKELQEYAVSALRFKPRKKKGKVSAQELQEFEEMRLSMEEGEEPEKREERKRKDKKAGGRRGEERSAEWQRDEEEWPEEEFFDDRTFEEAERSARAEEERPLKEKDTGRKPPRERRREERQPGDKKSDGRRGERPEGRRPENRQNEGQKSEGRRNEGRQGEGRQNEGRQGEGRQGEGRQSEGRQGEGRQGEGRQNEGRQGEGRQSEGRQGEGRQGEGRQNEGRQGEGRQSENRQGEGRQGEGRQNEGRQNEGRQGEGRQSEGRQNEGRQGEGRQNEGRQHDRRQNAARQERQAEIEVTADDYETDEAFAERRPPRKRSSRRNKARHERREDFQGMQEDGAPVREEEYAGEEKGHKEHERLYHRDEQKSRGKRYGNRRHREGGAGESAGEANGDRADGQE